MDKYSEEQIGAFYDHFKNNIQAYKQDNNDAVETLWDFLDFNKFKQTVLSWKNGDCAAAHANDKNDVSIIDQDESLFRELAN